MSISAGVGEEGLGLGLWELYLGLLPASCLQPWQFIVAGNEAERTRDARRGIIRLVNQMLQVVLSFLVGVSKKRIRELFSRNVPDQERSKQASHMPQIYFL